MRSITAQIAATDEAKAKLVKAQTGLMGALHKSFATSWAAIGRDAGITGEGVVRRLKSSRE